MEKIDDFGGVISMYGALGLNVGGIRAVREGVEGQQLGDRVDLEADADLKLNVTFGQD